MACLGYVKDFMIFLAALSSKIQQIFQPDINCSYKFILISIKVKDVRLHQILCYIIYSDSNSFEWIQSLYTITIYILILLDKPHIH